MDYIQCYHYKENWRENQRDRRKAHYVWLNGDLGEGRKRKNGFNDDGGDVGKN